MKNKTFKIITLGCKVNQYESASFKDSLAREGLHAVPKDDPADIAIINTCIVTQKASYQSRQAIRRAVRENPSGMTAAIGCYAQVFPEELKQIEGVDLIAGNSQKAQLPRLLTECMKSCETCVAAKAFDKETPFDLLPIKGFLDRARAFLKIQDGCNSFCSYCIVPFARGPVRSLDRTNVLNMLRSLSGEGYKEVVLTGIHLGKYGIDQGSGTDLKGLLRLIGREKLPLRIRLSSLEPNEIDEELIDMVADEDWLCRHFHIPLQSGDDGILKNMNRHYSTKEFRRLIETIHLKIPRAAIGLDVMAGFPGEDTNAHRNTCKLIDDLPVSYLHVFPFSPRKGTAAADFPNHIDPGVIKERAGELREMSSRKKNGFRISCLGFVFPVLVQGWHSEENSMIKGLSDNYLPVIFPSEEMEVNSIQQVRVKEIAEDVVVGRRVKV